MIAWALYQLAHQPAYQSALRAECLSYGDSLPFDQMDELPYLDAVTKEVLRCNPSIPSTVSRIRLWSVSILAEEKIREARKDDLIPLAEQVKNIDGQTMTEIPIKKGEVVRLDASVSEMRG